jgi:hypothetical protein
MQRTRCGGRTHRRGCLQDVNDRLATASSERGEYRQYLMEAQKELQKTRAELLEWSEGLSELKSVMEGLDGDLSDLFGEAEYSSVMSEALEATRRLPGAHARRLCLPPCLALWAHALRCLAARVHRAGCQVSEEPAMPSHACQVAHAWR